MSSAFGFRYAHENPFSYEFSCGVCSRAESEEDLDGMIICEGGCKRIFHIDCVGLSAIPDGDASKWACNQCITRQRSCHICLGVEPAVKATAMQRCSVAHCGKYFHKECIDIRYGGLREGEVCPLHACAQEGCTQVINDECYFCIFCLKAYHLKCMPEEVEIVCENACVCLDHQLSLPAESQSKSSFVDRLLSVQFGRQPSKKRGRKAKGSPTDEEISVPSTVCSPGQSKICHPDSETVPKSTDPMCLRDFIAANFMMPYKVPKEVSDENIVLSDDDELTLTTRPKQGPVDESGLSYIRLRTNEWVCAKPKRSSKNDEDSGIGGLCDCNDDGCDLSCSNRQCFIQCDASNCRPTWKMQKAGGTEWKSFNCGNKPFGKGNKADGKYKVVGAGGKGMGLFAKKPVEPHEYIVEYIGEVLTVDDWADRQRSEPPGSSKHFYVMDLDGDHVVDASRKGNESRLINHSCDPNLETQKWTVNGESRIGLFAIRPIAKNEELTFNYQFETFASKPFKCLCGTSKCTGWIGGRKKKDAANSDRDALRKRKAEILPIAMLQNLSAVDIPISVTRTDGTRKKDEEIALEEISACNQKIDYFLQYIWAGPVSGEEWIRNGRRCHALDSFEFNPAPVLALSVTKIEASFIRERDLMLLRQLHKARRDWARRFYVWPETTKAIEKVLEANWISDDCCVRCRRTGNLVWCKNCVRSFHQCCVAYGDLLKTDATTGEHAFTCRRCRRLQEHNKHTSEGGRLLVPPIRMTRKERGLNWKERRASHWNGYVLPNLVNGTHR
jgi:hypothetical protein